MNPYLHEFLYRLRSRSTVAVAVLTLLAVAIAGAGAIDTAPSVGITGVGAAYFADGAVHLDLWAWDALGHAVGGIVVGLEFVPAPNYTYPPAPLPTPVFFTNVTTPSSGAAEVVAPIPAGGYEVEVSSHYAALPEASLSGVLSNSFLIDPREGAPTELVGPVFNVVAVGNFALANQLLVFWPGPNGTSPAGDELVGCAETGPEFVSPPMSCSGMPTSAVGTLSGSVTIVPYPSLPTPALDLGQASWLILEILNSSGGVAYSEALAGEFGPAAAGVTVPLSPESPPGVGLLADYMVELGIFLPVSGFVLVYWGTTRPRATGSADMVLVRPVTRRGIYLARYASVLATLSVAATAEVLLFDWFVDIELGGALPAPFVPALIAGLIVSGMAFAGLLYLASHVFRTTGPTLVVGIVVLVVGSIFWTELVFLAYVLGGGTPLTSSFNVLQLRSQFVMPPQFPSVVYGFLAVSAPSVYSTSTYAAAGVTGGLLVVAGILWVAVPFALTLRRVVRND